MPRKKELSFEESLEKLEQIVASMESGDSNLKDLMANYSEGVQLGNTCLKALADAEKTMDLLVREDNKKVIKQELQIEGE
ncbi:Exodeoxyribonuclease VII small subunit [Selenomonas sp. WCT3]|uniref:exodeoxyribonuclease VII small subunit n=1 Tax=unclassified Selenomonas TaxID=2637378 RepID=UPI00088FB697|nr:exodeoxyribonuclease VII small subunit [Selenomonas sp.]MCR5438798.1 exodeoxyribonuclease VII small subunit [Selenomonas sp.]SDG53282.1 Exodeoxyribonuclease VII small subunit [Selenomonas ruminantium]